MKGQTGCYSLLNAKDILPQVIHQQQVSYDLKIWLQMRGVISACFPSLLSSLYSLCNIYIFKQTVTAPKQTICYPPEFAWLKIHLHLICIKSVCLPWEITGFPSPPSLTLAVPHRAIGWQGQHKGNQLGHCFESFFLFFFLKVRFSFEVPAESSTTQVSPSATRRSSPHSINSLSNTTLHVNVKLFKIKIKKNTHYCG